MKPNDSDDNCAAAQAATGVGVPAGLEVSRRALVVCAGGSALTALLRPVSAGAATTAPAVNLALMATPSCSAASTHDKLAALNSGFEPANSRDRAGDVWEAEHGPEPQWVEYAWSQPVQFHRIEVYWAFDEWDLKLPVAYQILYWDGSRFVPVSRPRGLERKADGYNATEFDAIRSSRLRLQATSVEQKAFGILQWKVWSSGAVPVFAPVVQAGVDRSVMVGGPSYLAARAISLRPQERLIGRWHKLSGPGAVSFGDATQAVTQAAVSQAGDYVLEYRVRSRSGHARSSLQLHAENPPPTKRAEVVYTTPYSLSSPLWKGRSRALIVSWIPHCIATCERSDLKDGQGGLDNFVEAAKALRGEPHGQHLGYVFSNAWVHQTIEAMCLGLMVDPEEDEEMRQAQVSIRQALERWIPIVLAAQHEDGYLQTAFTLAPRSEWPERWSPQQRGNHEGYVAGYFIEAAINHHTLTNGTDLRLYNAAKRLADCWVQHLGPSRKPWFDGHQQMEQALVRFGRFVNDTEGPGHGDAYIALARFLLESRLGGSRYDQSHLPPRQQYDAVGHAVRAVYFYSAMADIAAETGDRDYQSAVLSLWDNMVNRKYYVTGGVGSGDTSEGFGDDYALRHDAYCESCSSCGLVFFQYKLNLAYQDAKYADLYEETLYNALLGSIDLQGSSFTYTNPLQGSHRYRWHTCPCCVGNIPRTLLMLPTWCYTKDDRGLNVNLFVGGRMQVGAIKGTPVEMVQDTRYPWAGAVALTVNPAQPVAFALRIRMPKRQTSALYAATPQIAGLQALRVNGQRVDVIERKGYAVIERLWSPGDTVSFEIPLAVQRITADRRVEASRDQLALRYGPLVYNVELADQPRIDTAISPDPVLATWRPELLGGVMALEGRWQDGTPLTAVPHFARMNREGTPSPEFPGADAGYARSRVWIKAPA